MFDVRFIGFSHLKRFRSRIAKELGGSRRPRRLIDLESESFAEDGERHLILQDILAVPLQLQGWI